MADAERFGLDPASIEALRDTISAQDEAEAGGGVWPDNVEVVKAWCSISTQWRVVSVGGGMAPAVPIYIGLDYAAACAGLQAAGITITPELWEGIRIMEEAASAALNEAI